MEAHTSLLHKNAQRMLKECSKKASQASQEACAPVSLASKEGRDTFK